MVWVVDDLVEAALGPWGLAVGLGVGLLAAANKRRATGTSGDAVAETATTATTAAGAGLASVVAMKNGLVDRIQSALAEAGDSWRDLYAEAHHEWAQGRAGAPGTAPTAATAGAAGAATIAVATSTGKVVSEEIVPTPTGKRVRGPNGRYIREEA
jgi:hypothetical protein